MECGLKQWLGIEAPSVENVIWNNEIQTMWKQQQELGWACLFRGRFVQQWTTLQQEHVQSKNILSNKCTGQTWTIDMISFLWDMFYPCGITAMNAFMVLVMPMQRRGRPNYKPCGSKQYMNYMTKFLQLIKKISL
eukprot:3975622-Ditylum_brightwellii.AAC.1